MSLRFRVVYEDSDLVVIDKPPNFHTHAPEDKAIRLNRKWDATTILRKQLNLKVDPVHRLDRQTSGLVMFAKNQEIAKSLSLLFQDQKIRKTYFGISCGLTEKEPFIIDRPLKSSKGEMQVSSTSFEIVHSFQLPLDQGRFAEFSLLRIFPKTGRFHQIRRHLAGIHAPLLNDRKRGNKKLNRELHPTLKSDQLYLRAMKLEFIHPISHEMVEISNRWTRSWHFLFENIGFCALNNRPQDPKDPKD